MEEQKSRAVESKPEKKFVPLQMDFTQWIFAVIFFAISYGVLFFVGSARNQLASAVTGIPVLEWFLPIPMVWDNPVQPIWQTSMMHLLLPIVGFWMVFFLVDWIEKYYETRHAKSIVFPIVFFLFCMGALYIAIYWIALENSVLSGLTEVSFNFWAELQQSAFYLFMLAGLLGWLSRAVVERIKF